MRFPACALLSFLLLFLGISAAGQQGRKWAQYWVRELQLRQATEACSKHEDTVIALDKSSGHLIVSNQLDVASDADCPIMDIALRGQERGVGMCTDAALYVVWGAARIIPLNMGAYNTGRCANTTARVFLETMYGDFFSDQPGVTHLMQVSLGWPCHLWVIHLMQVSLHMGSSCTYSPSL